MANDLGSTLLRERKRKGLSRRELEARSGVKATTIFSIEKGRRGTERPQPATLLNLARGLDIDPAIPFGAAGLDWPLEGPNLGQLEALPDDHSALVPLYEDEVHKFSSLVHHDMAPAEHLLTVAQSAEFLHAAAEMT